MQGRDSQPGLPGYAQSPGAKSGYGGAVAPAELAAPGAQPNTESYSHIAENAFLSVDRHPLSTFAIDVDTASYSNVRRFLRDSALPPKDAVRIEELINYFRFDYPQPKGDAPFAVATELTVCPWNPKHRLALVGIQGREIDDKEPAPRNLVFLIDVSGSMQPSDKLPLVRQAMSMLASTLRERDRVLGAHAQRAAMREIVHDPRDDREANGVELAEQPRHGGRQGAVDERLEQERRFAAVLTLVQGDHLVDELLGCLAARPPSISSGTRETKDGGPGAFDSATPSSSARLRSRFFCSHPAGCS